MARGLSFGKRLVGIVLIFFCTLIFVQGRYGMPPVLERTFSSLLYPVLCVQHAITDSWHSWQESRRTHDELLSMVGALHRECDELKARVVELAGNVHDEQGTQDLRDFAYRYKALSSYGIIAQVLVRNLSEQEHFFLVDAGENRGVKKDMIAVYQNGLVGRVIDVWPAYSKVLLITDKLCKVACCTGSTNAHGIHEGANQVMLSKMTQVSHLGQMRVGDIVLSSGEGLVFPAGFGLGLVASCTIDGLFYRVDVELLYDMSEISYCYLFTKGEEDKKLVSEPVGDASNGEEAVSKS